MTVQSGPLAAESLIELPLYGSDKGAADGMTNTKAFVENYLPALLGQAWYVISTEFHKVVEDHGLSILEWRVLSTLASNGSMTISALSQMTVSKQPTVTRLLLRLETQGFVQRAASKDDRRCTVVKATANGRRLVSGLIAQAGEHERVILEPFSKHKIEMLKGILHELIDQHKV